MCHLHGYVVGQWSGLGENVNTLEFSFKCTFLRFHDVAVFIVIGVIRVIG